MAEHPPVTRPDALREIVRRLVAVESKVLALARRGGTYIDRGNTVEYASPAEGQVMIEAADETLWYFANQQWRQVTGGTGLTVWEIKVFNELKFVVAGNGAFIFAVPEDLDGYTIITAEAFVSTVPGAYFQVRVTRNGVSVMGVLVTIEAGKKNSYLSAIPSHVSDGVVVATGDEIGIDVLQGGGPVQSTAKGLGVIIACAPPA